MRALWFLMAAALFAACAGGHNGGSLSLTLAQQWEPRSLNPALENGTSAAEWGQLLFSYLLKYDDRGNLIGDVALEPPTVVNGGVSKDGLTITYHLRRGVRFADGTPLTAQDCVWSIQAINNANNLVQSRFGYNDVMLAQAPDAATLVLRLKRRFPPLITVVLAPQGFPILPKHLLAKVPDFNHAAFNQRPIGSGPYAVTRWIHGDRVIMRANPYYFRGSPHIPELTIRFVPDSQTAINELRTHEIEGFFDDQDLSNYPNLKSIPGYHVTDAAQNAVGAIIFNTRDHLTSDPRVRHALGEAIDIRSLIEKAYRGALEAHGAGRGLFLWAYDPRLYPDLPYRPGHARKLLDAAGWRMGSDGIRYKAGEALSLLFIIQAGTPGDQIVGNAVTQYERAVGANVMLKQFNITQFVAPADQGGPVYGGKFEMAYYPFENGDDPDTTDQFACKNRPPAGYNKSGLCDPRVDSLLRAGLQTYDPASRKGIYTRLEAVLYADLPVALLDQRRQVNAFSDRLLGVSMSLWGPFWNVGDWRLAPR